MTNIGLIRQWQPTLAEYVTNPDNSKLKSVESLTSLCNAIIEIMKVRRPAWTDDDYTIFALNAVYIDRERLGKAGHKLADDAEKTVLMVSKAFIFEDIRDEILIREPDDEVRAKLQQARATFFANKKKRTTAPPQPEPEPEPKPTMGPIQWKEPAAEPKPKLPTFKKPTRPGYIVPEEYGMIHYALSNNVDVCIEGDASAGKSLTIEVICETEEWNCVQIGKVIDDTMLKGFLNPITKEYTPSKLVRALKHDPEICPLQGHKTVICFDEGFTNMADYLTTLLPLVGRNEGGYIATEDEIIMRGDVAFVFIDNSTGDGGTTNYISRKPIDMALKSRLFYIHMKLSPKIAKAICADDKELLKFTEWMRKSVAKGKIDRLSLDNRGLNMIQTMKDWEGFTDEMLGEVLYGAFFKGCPPVSLATALRNVNAKPEELMANRYYVATQKYYEKLCKSCGLQSDPQAIKA